MGQLVDLGLARRSTRTTDLFETVVPDFLNLPYNHPSDYINSVWQSYTLIRENKKLNGGIFEFVLATLFLRESLTPLYLQASVAFVPNAIYDLLLFMSEGFPIGISAKTSLRERHKQAALEAVVLKNVHRKAKNFLVTLYTMESLRVKIGVENGDVIGLDKVVVASEPEFNTFIHVFVKPTTIDIVSAKRMVER